MIIGHSVSTLKLFIDLFSVLLVTCGLVSIGSLGFSGEFGTCGDCVIADRGRRAAVLDRDMLLKLSRTVSGMF